MKIFTLEMYKNDFWWWGIKKIQGIMIFLGKYCLVIPNKNK